MTKMETGLSGTREIVVEDKELASFMGNIGAEVLATPRLVSLLEEAARTAIKHCLPEGSITVGTMIRLEHFAATPPGAKVRAEATLKEIDGRRLVFDVFAYDDFEKIAEGEHERFIVSKERFLEKVRGKVKRLGVQGDQGSDKRGPIESQG